MNNLILCEGKTDAILLSYYLEKTCGWTHRNAPKGLDIKNEKTATVHFKSGLIMEKDFIETIK